MSMFLGRDLACIRGERVVFAGLGFAVESGGALLLRGPNGCGKSSLLRVLAGLLRPAEGTLSWDGAAVADDPEAHRARVQYVGHMDPVKAVLTVAETLAFWARLHGGDAAAVAPVLDRLGIAYLSDVPGRFLSAGQRRLVNLARLLLAPSPLWLLDEPTTALDSRATGVVEQAIAEHRAGGGMVVAATHTEIIVPGAAVLEVGGFSLTVPPGGEGAGAPAGEVAAAPGEPAGTAP